MMHRRWMRARLRAYHDGSLGSAARADLEAHLASCASCAKELQALEETDALLSCCRATVPVLDPADAQALFHAALSASRVEAGPTRWGGWRWQLAGAAVLGTLGATAYGLVGPVGLGARTVTVVSAPPVIDDTASQGDQHHTMMGKTVWSGTGTVGLPEIPAEPPPRRLRRHPGRRRGSPRGATRLMLASHQPRSRRAVTKDDAGEMLPTLFVEVERKPVTVQVGVTQAPPEAPGYAHASSVWYGPDGQVVTQATVSSCAPDAENEEREPGQPEQPEQPCGSAAEFLELSTVEKGDLPLPERPEQEKGEDDAIR